MPRVFVCVAFVQDRLPRRGRRQVGMRGGHSQSSFALSPSQEIVSCVYGGGVEIIRVAPCPLVY